MRKLDKVQTFPEVVFLLTTRMKQATMNGGIICLDNMINQVANSNFCICNE